MNRFLPIVLAGAVATLGWSTTANAKECKPNPVAVTGDMKITKIAAYPVSLFAWRKVVKEDHGASFQAWRRASDRKIECEQVLNDASQKRWQCTRTARPCAGSGKYIEPPLYPGQALRRGSSGTDVETVQRWLDDAGYDVVVDGDFGRKTRAAVKAFQRDEAISVDGVVGPNTWERLAA